MPEINYSFRSEKPLFCLWKIQKRDISLILFVVDFLVGLTLPGWAHLPSSIMNANSTLHIQNCKCTNGIYLKMHKVKDLFKITNNIFRKRHIHPKANFHKKGIWCLWIVKVMCKSWNICGSWFVHLQIVQRRITLYKWTTHLYMEMVNTIQAGKKWIEQIYFSPSAGLRFSCWKEWWCKSS